MQGKLRGDLGSALPFLPGLFIKLHKLLRSEFCYIAHLMWRLNMSPLIASCIHPQIVPWGPSRQLDMLASRPGIWLDASTQLLRCCKFRLAAIGERAGLSVAYGCCLHKRCARYDSLWTSLRGLSPRRTAQRGQRVDPTRKQSIMRD